MKSEIGCCAATSEIEALPEVMPLADELAAIDAATTPIEAVVDEILAIPAFTLPVQTS